MKRKGSINLCLITATVLALIILGGCANRPTYKLNLGLSKEPPAVLEIHCGHIYKINDGTGESIFDSNDPRYENAYPGRLELKPGQYTIDYGTHFYKTYTLRDQAILNMESGHLYKFARYRVMYEAGWLWFEDWTTSEVAGGEPPPRGVEEESQGLWWRYCPSIALDYLK